MIPPRRTFVVALGLCVALSCDRRDDPASTPASPPTSADPNRSDPDRSDQDPSVVTTPPTNAAESHAQMLAALEKIANGVRVDNPYFGEADIRELKANLVSLPPNTPRRRWRFEFLLGWNLTRVGRFEEAIEHLKVAYELAPFVEDDLIAGKEKNPRPALVVEPIPGMETAFELGLAYLRLAERGNCVEHHNNESCILPIQGGGVHTEPDAAQQAARYFQEVLEEYPADYNTRWLFNIAKMALGEYPDSVPLKYRIPPKALQSDGSFPRFEDIAPSLGLNDPDLSGGAVIDDFDGDDDLDLVTTSLDPFESIHVMQQEPDGSFRNVTKAAGLEGICGGLNLIHGDYDNDGDLDLFVLRGGWWEALGQHPNSLCRNEGGMRFVDVTYLAGLAEPAYPTQTADFGDFDNDGDLDLYVGNERGSQTFTPSQLFENRGDGTFVDVAARAGVTNRRYAKGVVFLDYDDDRFPDLYVSNNRGENRLYHNRGDGTFEDVAPRLGVTKPSLSFPVMAFDFDNDGKCDIFCAEFWNHPSYIVPYWFGARSEADPSCFYRNLGGKFEEIGRDVGLTQPHMVMGANFGDLDNDGFLDVYLGTGYPVYDGLVPNIMLWNQRGKSFRDVSIAGGFSHLQKGHGISFADLDADGDLDVFEQMGGAFPGDGFGDVLFENPGFDQRRIEVRLIGVQSNRFGVGARLRADIVENGAPRCVFRWVDTGGSFGGSPHRQHIGIGTATRVATLEVYWPTSDTKQTFHDVPSDSRIVITEFETRYSATPIAPIPFRK